MWTPAVNAGTGTGAATMPLKRLYVVERLGAGAELQHVSGVTFQRRAARVHDDELRTAFGGLLDVGGGHRMIAGGIGADDDDQDRFDGTGEAADVVLDLARIEIADFHQLIRRLIYPARGHGKTGGKGAGMFLAYQIVRRHRDENELLAKIKTPKTWFLTSDGMHDFVYCNHLGARLRRIPSARRTAARQPPSSPVSASVCCRPPFPYWPSAPGH